MSSHTSARRLSKGKKKSKSNRPPPIILPKAIRNELRMCVALRGYSALREGKGKTLTQQYACLEDFYHGKKGHSPSQIQMMAEGQLYYADLYDATTKTITSKKHKSNKKNNTTTRYYLKSSLTCDDSSRYYQGTDITVRDLEKKLRTGKAIIHGRQLETLAKNGIREYRKALSFTKDKWNIKNNEPKESGTTVDDVIEYVRRKMYEKTIIVVDSDGDGDDDDDEVVIASKLDKTSITNKNKRKDDVDDDGNANDDADEDDEDDDDDDDCNDDDDDGDDDGDDGDDDEDGKKTINDNNKNSKVIVDEKLHNDDDVKDKEKKEKEVMKITKKKKKKRGANDDDDSYEEEVDSMSSDSDSSTSTDDSDDDDDGNLVPPNYIFPSFMAYVLWGPFASKEKKLPLFLLGKCYIHICHLIYIEY